MGLRTLAFHMDRAWPGALVLFGARSTPVFALCAARRIGTNALDIKAGAGLQVINQFDKEFQEQSDDITSQDELAEHKQIVERVVDHLIYKDQVLVALTNNTKGAEEHNPFIVVHPNYVPNA